MKIGLLDHMGGGNLGDDTTQTAMIENIRSRWPDVTIYGFSMNPADTQCRHGIAAYPIRRTTWVQTKHDDTPPIRRNIAVRLLRAALRKPVTLAAECMFLLRSLLILRSFAVLVISGGGQLLDSWGGSWDYPYTILKWVVMAKLVGARCYFVNVGAGPIDRRLSQKFIISALRLADYVSFRDEASKALVRSIGYRGAAEVCPDLVYGLTLPHGVPPLRANVPIVGLAPMAYRDPRRYYLADPDGYTAFTRKIAQFGLWLTDEYRVVLFSTDIWFDAQTLAEIDATLHTTPLGSPITDLGTLLRDMAAMDYIITCRFHGVIFAHLMNIPVIALSHHPKVKTLMANLGLSEYCLDIDTFDHELLTTTFKRMVENKAWIKRQMDKKCYLYRRQLASQFDRLFRSSG